MFQQWGQCEDGIGRLCGGIAKKAGRDLDYSNKHLVGFLGGSKLPKSFKLGSHMSRYTYLRKFTLATV